MRFLIMKRVTLWVSNGGMEGKKLISRDRGHVLIYWLLDPIFQYSLEPKDRTMGTSDGPKMLFW